MKKFLVFAAMFAAAFMMVSCGGADLTATVLPMTEKNTVQNSGERNSAKDTMSNSARKTTNHGMKSKERVKNSNAEKTMTAQKRLTTFPTTASTPASITMKKTVRLALRPQIPIPVAAKLSKPALQITATGMK